MQQGKAKEVILERWEEIINQITSPAKERVNGHTSYICPICGHGTHGDGIAVNPKSKDRRGLKCFGCSFSGDIIDLIGEAENIRSYPEKLKRAGELIGITIDGKSPSTVCQPKQEDRQEDHTEYYRECKERLEGTDYYLKRGISKETATRFNLGYDPHYKVKGGEWEALIIPTGNYSYVARNTAPQAGAKDRYRKAGKSTPLNLNALQEAQKPIFITEGEIDALSIIEAGGEAIGLGSTANINLFVDRIKEKKPAQPLLLALDNDPAGEKAQGELEKALEDLGVACYVYSPVGEHKDANEALTANREDFIKAVARSERIEEEAEEVKRETYSKSYSVAGHIRDFINGIAESANTPPISTGFKGLDEELGGGLYEGLYTVGAVTSLGKTTFVLQIADQIAKSGKDVLIFSLEMARSELMAKSISRHTLEIVTREALPISNAKTCRGITDGARHKNYSDTESKVIADAVQEYSEYAEHLFIYEGVGDIGAKEIRQAVETHKARRGEAPVVIVDYLQILTAPDFRMTDKQSADYNIVQMKRISRDYKTPVIGISSLNRANYKQGSDSKGAVTLEAFKESGGLEYSSDVAVGLQFAGAGEKDFNLQEAKKEDPRQIELVILKNRNGKSWGKVPFTYYPLFNAFEEGIRGEGAEDRIVL